MSMLKPLNTLLAILPHEKVQDKFSKSDWDALQSICSSDSLSLLNAECVLPIESTSVWESLMKVRAFYHSPVFFCRLHCLEKGPVCVSGADRSHLTWELPKSGVAMATSRCGAWNSEGCESLTERGSIPFMLHAVSCGSSVSASTQLRVVSVRCAVLPPSLRMALSWGHAQKECQVVSMDLASWPRCTIC